MTTNPGYRWNSGTKPVAFDASKFPRTGVIGEIKPHNTAGIAAGIAQLSAGAGALVVQREIDAELVISFDPAAGSDAPLDPDALALRAGVLRLTLAHKLASGRIDTLHIDLP